MGETEFLDAESVRIWNETPYQTRLAITRYVMERIWEHARDGGSYRHLIYGRLGFDLDAYSYLFPVGMDISNTFTVPDGDSEENPCK